MNFLNRLNRFAGYSSLGLLAAIGVLGLLAIVPTIAANLATSFSEYQGDQVLISFLLGTPVAVFVIILIEVAYLFWLVNNDRILSPRVFKWVRLLSISSFALALSLLVIGLWLTAKNTLPRAVLFVLTALILLASAVGFVTRSLQGLLKKATDAAADLEGVI